jgi:uncharacterized protein (DUF2237 family)
MPEARNVLGGALKCCCNNPLTGFYRDGHCRTGHDDIGQHTLCAEVTQEFLSFSFACGNDLSTPRMGFPGLQPGDKWCVCVARWKEALDAGVAPPVVLEATDEKALLVVTMEELLTHATGTPQ